MSDNLLERLETLGRGLGRQFIIYNEAADEITRLRERLAEADEANRRVSDENEKLRFERDTIGEANYVNGWNDAINSSEAMQDLRKALLYVYDNSLGLDPDKITNDIEWVTKEIRAARKALETEK